MLVAVMLAAVPVVFWFNVGTSPTWMADMTTFVPLPRKYEPEVTEPAKAFMPPCAVVAPEPPFAKARVPAAVIVPLEVIGPPVYVRPVVPPETLTLVTVPEVDCVNTPGVDQVIVLPDLLLTIAQDTQTKLAGAAGTFKDQPVGGVPVLVLKFQEPPVGVAGAVAET